MSDTPRTDKFSKKPLPGRDTKSFLKALKEWSAFSRQLEHELSIAIKDAARYRWLRENAVEIKFGVPDRGLFIGDGAKGRAWARGGYDTNIDAAMHAEKK